MTSDPVTDTVSSAKSRFAWLYHEAYLGAYGIAGVLSTIGLLWLFLAIADEIPEQGELVRLDRLVAAWLESHGTEGGERIFFWVSYLGAPVLVASVVAVLIYLLWRHERRDALALAIASGTGVLMSTLLKYTFHRGRPETATEFITRHSWSFPSGHAMNSMVSYGFLAVLALERTNDRRERIGIVGTVAILVALIGFSRLYLGVHYLSDVVGGWMAGVAWLLICTGAYRLTKKRLTGGLPE